MPTPNTYGTPWDVLNDEQQMYLAQLPMAANPPMAAPMTEPELPPLTQLKSRTSMRDAEVAPLSKSEYDMLVDRLNSQGIESLRLQSEGIKDLESMRNALLNQDVQTDITPLMALVDSWSTSGARNNVASYKRPESGAEAQDRIRQMQGAIQKAREGLSGNELELLKSQLGIASQRELSADRAEERKLSREALKVQKDALHADKLDKQAQAQRESLIKTKQAEQVEGIIGFTGALNNYENLVKQHGLNPTGEAGAALASAYSELETGYKEAKRLGALSGPDMGILRRAIDNAGGFEAWFRANTKGGAEGIRQAAAQIRKAGQRDFDRVHSTLTKAYPGEATKPLLDDYKGRFAALKTSSVTDDKRKEMEAWAAGQAALPKEKRDPRYEQVVKALGN